MPEAFAIHEGSSGRTMSAGHITVLGANAGLDLTYEVPGLRLGGYHHPARRRLAAGGAKGVNVAQVLRRLGHDPVVTGFAGGFAGQEMLRLLREDGLGADFVPIAAESRLCLNLVDPETGSQTQVDEVGPEVTAPEVGELRGRWAALLVGASLGIISGSPPPGTPPSLYGDLVRQAHAVGVPVFVDCRGEFLAAAVAAQPDLIKPNREELEELVGRPLPDVAAVVAAARGLRATGVGTVVVSLGEAGAVAISAAHGDWQSAAPETATLSAVGSGDALLAGMAHAWSQSLPLAEQLRWGVASGAANAAALGACAMAAEDVASRLGQVTCLPLAP